MPLLYRWNEDGGLWGIWEVTETPEELEGMLCDKSLFASELEPVRSQKRRLELLGARVLLKTLSGGEKRVLHAPSGKPFLEGDRRRITISHTNGYVAVGIHGSASPGIDVERFGEKVRKVMPRFVRDDEMPDRKLMDDREYLCQLLLHWSAKETMYKVLEQEEVDFIQHLRVRPFRLASKGEIAGEEYRTGGREVFRLRYFIHPDFVCTFCVRPD